MLLPLSAGAHPFLNNTWQVLAESNRLAMRVTATLREVAVIQGLPPGQLTNLPALRNAVSNHAAYVLLSHLLVDFRRRGAAPWRTSITNSSSRTSPNLEDSDKYLHPYPRRVRHRMPVPCKSHHHRFRLEGHSRPTPRPASATGPWRDTTTRDPWDPFYVLLVADSNRRSLGQDIVRLNASVTIDLPQPLPHLPLPRLQPRRQFPPPTLRRQGSIIRPATAPGFAAFGPFLRHGLHHVLTGYDHLLFLAALALASRSWRRLLAIIGIFTLAHSITVTLARPRLGTHAAVDR